MPSKIEWTDETWNPITGCSPVSEGCRNCYAERLIERFPNLHGFKTGFEYREPFVAGAVAASGTALEITVERKTFREVHFHPDRLEKPLRWKKARKIFVCSMSDLFHGQVSDDEIGAILTVISACSRHTFLVLTKRPQRMQTFFERHRLGGLQGGALAQFDREIPYGLVEEGPALNGVHGAWPLPNLWLGVTAENQQAADERIPILLEIPAAKRFVSIEPMLGPVSLTVSCPTDCNKREAWQCGLGPEHACPEWKKGFWPVDWVICGGESGPGARPMQKAWALSLRDQCQRVKIPFFFKQWGEFKAGKRVGKKAAGRLLGGRQHDEWPGG